MARFILLLIVGVIVFFLLRAVFRKLGKIDPPPPATTSQGEDMVTCARCGVNLPRSEAVEQDGLLVCRENPACKPKA